MWRDICLIPGIAIITLVLGYGVMLELGAGGLELRGSWEIVLLQWGLGGR